LEVYVDQNKKQSDEKISKDEELEHLSKHLSKQFENLKATSEAKIIQKD
jgi:hypothetical protein